MIKSYYHTVVTTGQELFEVFQVFDKFTKIILFALQLKNILINKKSLKPVKKLVFKQDKEDL